MESSGQEATYSGSQETEDAIDTEMSTLSITEMENSGQEASDSGNQETEETIDTETSALSVTEFDKNTPCSSDGIEKGTIVLLQKNSREEYNQVVLRPWSCKNSRRNSVVEPRSVEDMKYDWDAFATNIRIMKTCGYPTGVIFNSSKVGQVDGKYRENIEYKIEAVLGEGSSGKVERIFDLTTGNKCARKKVRLADFNEVEVIALCELTGSRISPDLYACVIDGDYVYIFMEEITNGIALSKLIAGLQKSKHGAQIMLYLLSVVLVAFFEIHKQGWLHKDPHEDNIAMEKEKDDSVRCRILDFGEASCNPDAEYDSIDECNRVCNLFRSISEDKSKLDKSAQKDFQLLKKKLPDTAKFQQYVSKRHRQATEKVYFCMPFVPSSTYNTAVQSCYLKMLRKIFNSSGQ